LLQRSLLFDQIDLVLENDNVLELHDLNSGQVLSRLRLGARLVACNEQQRGVHNSRTIKHGGHKNIVTRAIDERNVAQELPLARITRAIL